MSSATIAVLPGDGVGPEVTSQALSALLAVEERFGHDFTFVERPVGLDAILSEGVAISEETVQACRESDAILFGAIGSLSDDMAASRDVRPEQALFVLRRGFDFYANLRPVRTFVSMEQSSPLRPERISGTDLMFVRELSAGLYYGFAESTDHKPSEIRQYDGGLEAIDTTPRHRSSASCAWLSTSHVPRTDRWHRSTRRMSSAPRYCGAGSSILWPTNILMWPLPTCWLTRQPCA